MSTISPLVEINVFATYKRQQTMLERQKWTNFQPEMQYQVTTNYDNCPAGPSAKIGVLGGDDFKTDKNYVDKEAPPSEWKYKLNKLQHKKGKGFCAPGEWKNGKEQKHHLTNEMNWIRRNIEKEKSFMPPSEWNINWISCNTKKENAFAPPAYGKREENRRHLANEIMNWISSNTRQEKAFVPPSEWEKTEKNIGAT